MQLEVLDVGSLVGHDVGAGDEFDREGDERAVDGLVQSLQRRVARGHGRSLLGLLAGPIAFGQGSC